MTSNQIAQHLQRPVRITYRTINLGNGSSDEQEHGTLIGHFTGDANCMGRTWRYDFISKDGEHFYLFADEIKSIRRLRRPIQLGTVRAGESPNPFQLP